MFTEYVSSPSQAQDWSTAMELTEKNQTKTQQQTKQLLLKSSLPARVSFSRGNSSDFFQLQWRYSEPAQKQQLVLSFTTFKKKPKRLMNVHRGDTG